VLNFHPRLPSIDHGVVSFLWAVGLGAFIWFGLRAVDVGNAPAFVIACVSAFAIFLYVRVYGEEDTARRP
jgi:amino acid permease